MKSTDLKDLFVALVPEISRISSFYAPANKLLKKSTEVIFLQSDKLRLTMFLKISTFSKKSPGIAELLALSNRKFSEFFKCSNCFTSGTYP